MSTISGSESKKPFRTALRKVQGAVVLEVSGTVDLDTVGSFREALAETLARSTSCDGGTPCVVVDLTECEAMDYRGLREVLDAAAKLRDAGGRLKVADAVAGPVRRMFEAAREDYGLPLYPDAQAALAAG